MSERRARPAPRNGRKSVWRRALTQAAAPPAGSAAPAPAPAPEEPADTGSIVQAALYRDGVRISSPATLADTFRELLDERDGMAWIGLARPTEAELLSWPTSSTCTRSRWRTRWRRTNGRSWSGTAKRSSSCCAPPVIWTPRRRSTSASSMCSSARTSSSRSGTARRRTCRRSASVWRSHRNSSGWARRRCSTRSSTRWSMDTPRGGGRADRHRRDRDRGLPR